ncbi:MAG: crossover junction endodeoxyribonuclease RuvC [Verrucomicrobia bacterium]|nr:crossover junction endodeoxyribonuclease RuvC [Verrucomicrobiota bacterium]
MAISTAQYARMRARLESPRARDRGSAVEAPVGSNPSRRPVPIARVILGVDPSLRGTGHGVIQFSGGGARALAYGVIKCPANWLRSRCLARLTTETRDLVRAHQPTHCVVEGLFYAQNLRTALILGEARGAILAALAEAGVDIYELAPRKVKQAVVGYGAAQKSAVAKMVQRLLGLKEPPEPDAADALALAWAFAQETRGAGLTAPPQL